MKEYSPKSKSIHNIRIIQQLIYCFVIYRRATVKCVYSDDKNEPTTNLLGLVFQKIDDIWVLVHDQNTLLLSSIWTNPINSFQI